MEGWPARSSTKVTASTSAGTAANELPVVQALWEELLDKDDRRPRLSRIYYKGRYFQYPLQLVDALQGLGPVECARILLSYTRARLFPARQVENFEQWVSTDSAAGSIDSSSRRTPRRCGASVHRDPRNGRRSAFRGSPMRALLSATPLNRRPTPIKTLIHQFKYPWLGPGQMWEACRDRVIERGGRVLLEHEVTRPELVDGRVRAMWARTPDGDRRFEAEHFISTAPLRALIGAAGDSAPPSVQLAARGLSYRDFIVVALMLDRAELFPDNWLYIHSPDVRVGRVQNFNNWSAALVPDQGRTCLGLEYFCSRGDDLWAMDDASLAALAKQELSLLGPARGADVVDSVVVRVPDAYPVYDSTIEAPGALPRRGSGSDRQPPYRRPQRHAQVQQSGSLDVCGDADRRQPARRGTRHMGGQLRLRVPRGRPAPALVHVAPLIGANRSHRFRKGHRRFRDDRRHP